MIGISKIFQRESETYDNQDITKDKTLSYMGVGKVKHLKEPRSVYYFISAMVTEKQSDVIEIEELLDNYYKKRKVKVNKYDFNPQQL